MELFYLSLLTTSPLPNLAGHSSLLLSHPPVFAPAMIHLCPSCHLWYLAEKSI